MNKKREEEKFTEDIRKHSSFLKKFRGKGIVWHYIATIGAIGWVLAIPTVIGAYLGRYIDTKLSGPGRTSWTITFILLGLAIGIYSVWRLFFYRIKR